MRNFFPGSLRDLECIVKRSLAVTDVRTGE